MLRDVSPSPFLSPPDVGTYLEYLGQSKRYSFSYKKPLRYFINQIRIPIVAFFALERLAHNKYWALPPWVVMIIAATGQAAALKLVAVALILAVACWNLGSTSEPTAVSPVPRQNFSLACADAGKCYWYSFAFQSRIPKTSSRPSLWFLERGITETCIIEVCFAFTLHTLLRGSARSNALWMGITYIYK